MSVFPHWPLSELAAPCAPRVAWMREQPLHFVGGWEPLSFRRRAGYAWTDEQLAYNEYEWSDTALDAFVAMGCNLVVIPFAKGFGLSATHDELRQEKELACRARERGLKVGVYIRVDAVIPETLARDFLDVDEWLARGMYGRTSVYAPQQTFRKRICHNHPSAVRYLQSLFEFADAELNADLLHLDGFQLSALPWNACRCERCTDSYRQWLRERYADAERRDSVFGLIDLDRVAMPEFTPGEAPQSVVASPEIRAWHRFQWDRELAFARHVRRFVREMNPATAISINPFCSTNRNHYRLWSQWAERLFPWFDAVWSEDDLHLRYDAGRIVSKHGFSKRAREYDVPVCAYHWHASDATIEPSVNFLLAANGGNPSCAGFTFRFLPHYTLGEAIKRRLGNWARDNWSLFRGARPAGEIAVLHHQPSLAWNARRPWWGYVAVEQLLVRMKVPWRVVDRADEDHLAGVKTLLAVDVESLSDEELQALEGWVRAGGRLLFSRHTATHDGDRVRRPRNPIFDWVPAWREINDRLGPRDWFAWMSQDYVELEGDSTDGDIGEGTTAPCGSGVLALLPDIQYTFQGCTLNGPIPASDLRPPRNADQLQQFLRDVNGPFDIECIGSDSLIVDVSQHAAEEATLIHVVQVDGTAEPVDVEVRLRDGVQRITVEVHSPDERAPALEKRRNGLTLRSLQRYAVVTLTRNPR